jgi:uncharacterized membrane protein YfcA
VIAVLVPLAVLVGVALGLLGGGGSILTVPLLTYVGGLAPAQAVAASLFVVGVTAAVGAVGHARAGRVRWRTGLLFGGAGMVGAFAGGLLGAHLPGAVLLTAFAVVMLATAIAMLRGRRQPRPAPLPSELPVGRAVLDGALVGLVTGLVGAGGGFLVVPALALLGGLPMPVAVGTSLVVIAMKSFAGLGGYLTTVSIPWGTTLAVTAAAVLGAVVGGRLVARVPQDALGRAFGWFVLAMAVVMLVQQLPVEARWGVAGLLAALATGAATCAAVWPGCPVRTLLGGIRPVS